MRNDFIQHARTIITLIKTFPKIIRCDNPTKLRTPPLVNTLQIKLLEVFIIRDISSYL